MKESTPLDGATHNSIETVAGSGLGPEVGFGSGCGTGRTAGLPYLSN